MRDIALAVWERHGRFFLQRRALDAAILPGLWEFPGGKVEPGEAPKIALMRELARELAIQVAPEDLVPATFSSADSQLPATGRQPLLLLYLCRRWNGAPICLDADRIEWFDVTQIASLPMPPLDVPLATWLAKTI